VLRQAIRQGGQDPPGGTPQELVGRIVPSRGLIVDDRHSSPYYNRHILFFQVGILDPQAAELAGTDTADVEQLEIMARLQMLKRALCLVALNRSSTSFSVRIFRVTRCISVRFRVKDSG
jgi:hypothetical protein